MAPQKPKTPKGPKAASKPAPSPAASSSNDLQAFVSNVRERKKNEDLASKIFGASKNRRQSAPSNLKPNLGGSLASRVGVKKQRASLGPRSNTTPGNINGVWTHDLHGSVQRNSLASRISSTPTGPKAQRNLKNRAANLNKMDIDSPAIKNQANVRSAPAGPGISIRGLAGPFAVMAQNFAPGTTAADIESAMTPIGGAMESCRIIKTKPLLIAEMVFSSREGGERVIQTFNEKTADGRLLKVYPKIGGAGVLNGPREQVVDGSMGFAEKQGLYSDNMVGGNTRSRGGGQRGRSGR